MEIQEKRLQREARLKVPAVPLHNSPPKDRAVTTTYKVIEDITESEMSPLRLKLEASLPTEEEDIPRIRVPEPTPEA